MRFARSTRTLAHRLGGAVVTLALAMPAWAQPESYDRYHGPGMMWNGGWAGWFIGPVMMLIFLAAAVAAVVLLVRWLGGAGHGAGQPTHRSGSSALEILEQRFARGEIDDEEFRQRKQALSE